MTIYAIRATDEGRARLRLAAVDQAQLSLRCTTLLAITAEPRWHRWQEISMRVTKIIDGLPDALAPQFSGYLPLCDSMKATEDALRLEKLSLVELARFQAKDGRLAKAKPVGMLFRIQEPARK